MNIYQRINKVMQTVKYVQKDATVQNYKAVSHDQVVAKCRPAFVENGIVIYPEQIGESRIEPIIKADGTLSAMMRYQAKYAVNFVNMDKPDDKITVSIEAHAQDNCDKAPGKALTYATKAAILKVLCLETGESDESRMQEIDTSEDIALIESCEDLKALQETFVTLHKKYSSNKTALAEIIAAKDRAKKKLGGTYAG